jgi:hypothetical protein
MKKTILILLAGVMIGYGLNEFWPKKPKWDSDALFLWTLSLPCVTPTESETKRFELAAEILESEGGLWLDIGAIKFLSHGIYRDTANNKKIRVCSPLGVYQRASDAITHRKLLNARTQEHHLKLASKIEHPSPYIIETVAKVAFSTGVQIDNNKDIRPLARSILASFGELSKEYSNQAFEQMGSSTPLGTGAAQIAVATAHPDALQRTQELMNEILGEYAAGEAISYKAKDRFSELSYGLALAGDSAKLYTAPIENILERKIMVWGGWFGNLPADPKNMCRVLYKIDPDNKALRKHEYCKSAIYSSSEEKS